MNEDELRSQHAEDVHELARHHRDFARISAIIDKVIEQYGADPYVYGLEYLKTLSQIRNIVG